MKKKISVLVVDDSALVRKLLIEILNSDPDIEVSASARDPYDARDKLVKYRPDVITLDIEMPKMDGVTFLKTYMQVLPTPTVIVSSLAEKGKQITLSALEAGAVDIVKKPSISLEKFFSNETDEIIRKIKNAAKINVASFANIHPSIDNRISEVEPTKLGETTDKVIAIGASTGGVEALTRILPVFPATSPGIVIVQHMPEGFTKSFAKRLDGVSKIRVKEAEDNDRVCSGTALIAPGGNKHIKLKRVGGQYRVFLEEGEKVSFNRPSVDVLFDTIADQVGSNAVSVLMTGMGKDGAKGMLNIRNSGGQTIIQDEYSCVVFGMGGTAQALGAHQLSVPLADIPKTVIAAVRH